MPAVNRAGAAFSVAVSGEQTVEGLLDARLPWPEADAEAGLDAAAIQRRECRPAGGGGEFPGGDRHHAVGVNVSTGRQRLEDVAGESEL